VHDLQALGLTAGDVLAGIATSGRTPYVCGGVEYARRLGTFTIGLSCNRDSDLLPLVDLPITPVVGPEVLTGSTRLKAGTATKLVLNMLTTGAMVLLGKTYGNLMVDLRATNSKLRARTNRIIRMLTGLGHEAADQLLRDCSGELKTALVSHLGQVPSEEARRRLEHVGGRVRMALERTGVGQAARLPGQASRLPYEAAPAPAATLQPADDLVLGIDGGGTHTVALLARANENGILGRGEAGPSNLQSVGETQALQALGRAIQQAWTAAGLSPRPVSVACLGLAGAGREEDRRIIQNWAERHQVARRIQVTTDAALLLAEGTPEGWGVAVIAGTGSIAFGQSADGRRARAGGWGPLLGDEGSAYGIVRAALAAVARAADGRGPATSLRKSLLDAMSLSEPSDLVRAVHAERWDRAALAGLAPVIFAAATAGDAVAEHILMHHAGELALAAASVARELFGQPGPLPLALAGGLFVAHADYQARFLRALEKLHVPIGPTQVVSEPARGALRLALRAKA
jgi:N-acetylmuramic acid 6-phosphate etherase